MLTAGSRGRITATGRADVSAPRLRETYQCERRTTWIVVAFVIVACMPAASWAQATIAGLVRDSSGAVLPGVTVEASSDVLIEKVRTAVTDGNGRYQIVDLRAGTYAVTFTLPGFSTVKRDGVELTGLMTATINADLRVGHGPGNDHRDR